MRTLLNVFRIVLMLPVLVESALAAVPGMSDTGTLGRDTPPGWAQAGSRDR
jgi:hypothetical protein